MRNQLFVTLLLSLPFAACADGGRSTVASNGPAAPINEPDTRVIEPSPGEPPTEPGENNSAGLPASNGNGNGNGAGSGGNNVPGTGGLSAAGGTSPSTTGPGSNGSGPGGSTNGAGQGGSNGGSQSGSPVPEPGTLLLFGTGLAGIAGFSLRRRRRES